MGEKRAKGKVIHKHETAANWELSSYVPDIGEVVFYDPDENYNYTRQKNGDGINKVHDLPFSSDGKTNLMPNEVDSVIQKGNCAADKNSAVFGSKNQTYAEFAFADGQLNLSGVKLTNFFNLNIEKAELYTAEDGSRYTKISLYEIPESLEFMDDPAIVIYANGLYYSCRPSKYFSSQNILYFLNHNASDAINAEIKNSSTSGVKFYRINSEAISEKTHTEHVEGAYNISCQGGNNNTSSKASHVEGHTNINFGDYSHVEGVQNVNMGTYNHVEGNGNKVLSLAQFSRISGRQNILDAGAGVKTVATNIWGEKNTVGKASYSQIGGAENKIPYISYSYVDGLKNEANSAKYSRIGGQQNKVNDVQSAIIHGEFLEVSGQNKAVFGQYNAVNNDALFIVGCGWGSSQKHNAFEISKEGELSFRRNGTLAGLNGIIDQIIETSQNLEQSIKQVNNSISLLGNSISTVQQSVTTISNTANTNKTNITSLESRTSNINKFISVQDETTEEYYYPSIGTYEITGYNNISKIAVRSKNLLDRYHYYVNERTLTGLTLKAQENGTITIQGKITKDQWPQLELYYSSGNEILNLQPGKTYTVGRICANSEVILRFAYKKGGTTISKDLTGSGASEYTFTWDSTCTLSTILIQTNKQDYSTEVVVYPYIYEVGKEPSSWVPNYMVDYTPAKDLFINIDYKEMSMYFTKQDSANGLSAKFNIYNDLPNRINGKEVIFTDTEPEFYDEDKIYFIYE